MLDRYQLHSMFGLLFLFTAASTESAFPTTIQTIAGTGKSADGGDFGGALETNIGQPFGVEIGPGGALYITEVSNHRVRRLDLGSGQLTTVAGCGEMGYDGDGGPATKAKLNQPYEVRFDSAGNMFFVEMDNNLVRKVDAKTGLISTVAGTGPQGFSGDGGPAAKALMQHPHSIDLDETHLYIADIGNHRIRRVDLKTGIIETIAGNGKKGLPRDGEMIRGKAISGPRALAIDGRTLWIALREGHSVWRLDLDSGKIYHVAGTGEQGYSGDGGPAKSALFDGPKGIDVGPDGNVYVVDTENQAIRKIDRESGIITTVAGHGPQARGAAGDGGPSTQAELNRPHGICIGRDGAIYLGDSLNHRVRRVK